MVFADGLKVRTERRGPVHILTVTGDLGVGSTTSFTTAVEHAVAEVGARPARVVIDLSGVRSVDPAGARALTAAATPVAGQCRVVLRSLRPALRQVAVTLSPDLDLTGSGLVMVHPEVAAGMDPGSPASTLERESQRARSVAEHTITGARRAAEMIAVTEDEIAATLLRLAPGRPTAHDRLMELSEHARRHARQLRGLTGSPVVRRTGHLGANADRSGTLKRAIAFMDEHARDDINIADVASAASVTVRAVQLAFRRYLGVTPLGYLRQVRLEQARRELLAASPAAGAVTRIAADWQFTNLSRFTARYRAAYGVLPSQTLHNAPPAGAAAPPS